MKTIKFRGRRLNADKDFVYGDLIQYPTGLPLIKVHDEEEWEKGFDASESYEVYPDVAQFLGYDKNGEEIYSDDKIRVYDSYKQEIVKINAENFFMFSDIGETFDNAELVEKN